MLQAEMEKKKCEQLFKSMIGRKSEPELKAADAKQTLINLEGRKRDTYTQQCFKGPFPFSLC